jgi:pimeloyl-ACP methyl ester carboxylesterase
VKYVARALLVASLALGAPACLAAEAAPADASPDTVVLLHGLAGNELAMRLLAMRVRSAGFQVHALSYQSTRKEPGALVNDLAGELADCCAEAQRLHFVTHSLGGLLLRAYLAEHELPNLGRVVMLAPPNHGSELIDKVAGWGLLRLLFGPVAPQLGTSPASLPNRLPPADFEVGVIAGTRSLNPLGAWLIPSENDGSVSVASARLDGMRDFVTVPVSHTLILLSSAAARHTVAFLADGHFAHPDAAN